MSTHLRLFFAIHVAPTPPLRRVLNRLARFAPAVRPADRAALHLTLRFLGDTPASRVDELGSALDRAAAGRPALTLTLTGLGRFDADPRRPLRVIFAKVAEVEPIITLADALGCELGRLDPPPPPDDRPPRPHVTLARVKKKPPDALLTLIEEHATADLGVAPVDAAHLIASELTREGPIYTTMHTTKLC